MTGAVFAVIGCAALCIAAIVAHHVVTDLRDRTQYEGRHAFADPRDTTDPDGEQYVEELHHDWWDQPAPADRVQILTGPLAAAGRLAMLPPDPPLHETGPIPHAVATWGKTAPELLDELEFAARYIT